MDRHELDLEREAIRLAYARVAAHVLRNAGVGGRVATVAPGDVVIEALVDALETLKAIPDPDRRFQRGIKTGWPEPHWAAGLTEMEIAELWWVWNERVKIGEVAVEQVVAQRPRPTAREVSRMWVVLSWSRLCVGRRPAIDWRLLMLYAQNVPVARIAKAVRCSRQSVYDRMRFQTSRVAAGLAARHFDAPGLFKERGRAA